MGQQNPCNDLSSEIALRELWSHLLQLLTKLSALLQKVCHLQIGHGQWATVLALLHCHPFFRKLRMHLDCLEVQMFVGQDGEGFGPPLVCVWVLCERNPK